MSDNAEYVKNVDRNKELDGAIEFKKKTLLGRMTQGALNSSLSSISENGKIIANTKYTLLGQLHTEEWNKETEGKYGKDDRLSRQQIIDIEKVINDPRRLADALNARVEILEKLYNEESDPTEKEEIALGIDVARSLETDFLNESLRGE